MSYLPKKATSFIFHFACQQKVRFSLLAFCFFMWGVGDSFYPYFLKKIVNKIQLYHGQPAGIYAALGGVLVLLVLFWLTGEALMRVQGITQVYTFPAFRANIRRAVFNYVKLHSHEYFASNFSGNIAKKLSDLPNSCQTIMEIVCFNFVTAFTGVILVFSMMWLTNSLFALILVIWLIIHLALTFAFLRYGNKLWEAHSESASTLSGKIVDVFTNMLNVRLFSRGDYELQYLQKYQDDEVKKGKKALLLIEFMRIGQGINGLFLVFSLLFLLIHGWAHHWVTLGDFTQVSMQAFWLLGWMWFVSFQLSVFARELGTVSDALTVVRKEHGLVDNPNAANLVISTGDIVFNHVHFAYHKNRPVFDDLNLVIPAGQKVGLVGFSGSGKSTFVNLILRFYDLQSGEIKIDGQNIKDATQDSLRSQIGMIPQDPALFHRTLIENIRYGKLEATDEEVIQASKLADCHEFIEKLDEQYNSLVGERGVKLSGGQRQRVAIARAILKNAPILILDEATSSLDSVTEKLIQKSLNILMEGKTTIVVAHRLSTLSNMDRILVFHQGKIIEEGTKDTLLAKQGHFATLWNMQTDGFLPEEK
jgi:ATP-binding cassette subfamily B protein